VTALYADEARTFWLTAGATFGDLAERVAEIEARSGRKPIAVDVKCEA
jgi:hypothetical protein